MTDESLVALRWEGGWGFTGTDGEGNAVSVGAPSPQGEAFTGFRPTHLMLTALGACTGVDVVSILRKKRQDVTGVEIRVGGEQQDDWPKAWTSVNLHYVVRGRSVDPRAVGRAIELSESAYCSVGATLKGVARITTSFEIVEEGE